LILFYEIKKGSPTDITSPSKQGTSVKQEMIDWWRRALQQVPGAEVKGLTSSFSDGYLFLALLSVCNPLLVQPSDINRQEKADNLRKAFSLLKSEYGVQEILEVEGW
jgi:hypothetical protein